MRSTSDRRFVVLSDEVLNCPPWTEDERPAVRLSRELTRISHQDAEHKVEKCLSLTSCGALFGVFRVQTVLGAPWFVFSASLRTCSNVVPATPFGHEHALKRNILRHDHAPW